LANLSTAREGPESVPKRRDTGGVDVAGALPIRPAGG
jgi:hypothetical protein